MKKIKKRIAALLDFPESSFGAPCIEMISDSTVNVNGCKEIIDYSDTMISLMTAEFLLTIEGTDLEICSYGGENSYIKGRISAVKISREGRYDRRAY